MTWKKILKAPIKPDEREHRDSKLKLRVKQFEKEKIEPAFRELLTDSPEGKPFGEYKILVGTNSATGLNPGSQQFNIDTDDLMGIPKEFFARTLKEIYENAGFDVTLRGHDKTLVVIKEK